MRQEAEVAFADVEDLDRVGDRRRVVPPQRFELLGGQRGRRHGRDSPVGSSGNGVVQRGPSAYRNATRRASPSDDGGGGRRPEGRSRNPRPRTPSGRAVEKEE